MKSTSFEYHVIDVCQKMTCTIQGSVFEKQKSSEYTTGCIDYVIANREEENEGLSDNKLSVGNDNIPNTNKFVLDSLKFTGDLYKFSDV